MKKIISLYLLCISTSFYAQNKDFSLGVVLPNATDKITESALTRLETKLISILNQSSVLQYGFSNDIVVTPLINIEDNSMVQGGLENIAVVKLEITYLVKQLSTGTTFGSFTKKYNGSGKNEPLAITNAFSQIKSNDKGLQGFLNQSKESIFSYYIQNCEKLIDIATNNAKMNDFEQAISLLQSIPDTGNNCYKTAQNKSIEYYNAYQNILCSKNIANAKAEIAVNNFDKALYYLNIIDPSSSCFTEVNKLIAQLSSKVEKKETQKINQENDRLKAIQNISRDYYQNYIRLNRTVVIISK